VETEDAFDVYFLFGEIPRDDEVAWQEFRVRIGQPPRDKLGEELPEEVLRFYAGFYIRFPELFASESLKGSERLFLGPLVDSISVLHAPVEHADELFSFACGLGRDLGVTIFDPSSGYFHRPDGFGDITMTAEDQPVFFSPNSDQIGRVVQSMTASGGPSTLILDAQDGSYAQTAGGDGKYTCEWREVSNGSFQHWVAGRKTKVSGTIRIPTNGFEVEVNSNECLSVIDVTSILDDFASGKSRRQKWNWRDVTDQFQ
jgi:hypothetical protein